MLTYTQEEKNNARRSALSHAVKILTSDRNKACCVGERYVRDIYQSFLDDRESKCCIEAEKIPQSYIREWERLHFACRGNKRPEDLIVCYLAGPEPQNDFNELIGLGVLPQNIWAFEYDKGVFEHALSQCSGNGMKQPKLVGMSIEGFLQATPRKFDIVYFDFCSSFLSHQNSLRCVANLFRYHRLSSPGALITNFCLPDMGDRDEFKEYCDAISTYFFSKGNEAREYEIKDGLISNTEYIEFANEVSQDVIEYYSEFITSVISNIGSIAVPAVRMANSSAILKNFIDEDVLKKMKTTDMRVNDLGFDGLTRALLLSGTNQKLNLLSKNLMGSPVLQRGVLDSLVVYHLIRTRKIALTARFDEALASFEFGEVLYQFLDKPSIDLIIDYALRQLSYPMHYSPEPSRRLSYTAKTKLMMLDVSFFDECRYIYDWLPASNQISVMTKDVGLQYVLRFALDGLVKRRMQYDGEYFFSGSVISSNSKRFPSVPLPKRETI